MITTHFYPGLQVVALLVGLTHARDVPANIRNLYSTIKSEDGCRNILATGFYSTEDGPDSKRQTSLSDDTGTW
jgi:hypothetical protein